MITIRTLDPMIHPDPTSPASARRVTMGDLLPCVWMLVCVVLAFPLFAAYGYTRFGWNGILSAATAGFVCWLATEAALLLTIWFRETDLKLHSVLLGTFFRTGIPLVFGMLLHNAGGPLAESGLFGMILVYYLLTLSVETILAVQLVSKTSTYKKAV